MHQMTTEEMFKMRAEHEKQLKEKAGVYLEKLRTRKPHDYKQDKEEMLEALRERENRREYYKQKAEKSRQSKEDFETRISNYLEKLKSTTNEDIEVNAQVLTDLLRSFSLTFGVSNEVIANIVSQEAGELNVENIRKKLMTHAE